MSGKNKIMLIIAVILPLIGIALPFWVLEFNAPMFGTRWLTITVYGYGGVTGPLDQINVANHYVGLSELHPERMIEIKLLPLAFILAALIAAVSVWKRNKKLLLIYIAILILVPAYFQYWLYNFGHNINWKEAAIHIEPFTPLVMGYYQIANFKAKTYFHAGYWVMVASLIISYYTIRSSISKAKSEQGVKGEKG